MAELLKPSEIVLTGQWLFDGHHMSGDAVTHRIRELTEDHLVKLADDWSAWDALYRDPNDGRLWERIYPQSYLQGGGPPQLQFIGVEDATAKYGVDVLKGKSDRGPKPENSPW